MVLLCGVTVMFLAGLPLVAVRRARRRRSRSPRRSSISMMHGYQRKRIDVFLDPESDPLGAGYHIAQSKIAIGSGGIWGKGFLHGSQSHLDYLPEGHTDFVFATMAEEWGLVGGVLLIFAFAAGDPLGNAGQRTMPARASRQLAAAGLSATIFFYVSINLMMVMGLAPVVGVPLPLVSFGGSAVMTVMLCLGLLMALERQQRTVVDASPSWLKCGGCAPPEPMLPAPPLQSATKPPEHPPHGSGRIAQLVEQLTLNQRVLGSSPSASTTFSPIC